MRRILITGANSYIGVSFEEYLAKWPDKYSVQTVDMMDDKWRITSFSGFDSIFHVAGIAHNDQGKIDEIKEALYYKVNTDLAVETAKKAKHEGVKQFIFMSSIIVYGASVYEGKAITRDTVPNPQNAYGDSKLKAEKSLLSLEDDKFKIVILRPPMIYGKGCKGNYPILAKYARKLPIFPDIGNKRSMLYVGNLMEFIKLMVDNNEAGVFYPQNREYVCTSEMVKTIAHVYKKNILLTKVFNPFIYLLSGKVKLVNKVFGDLYYDMSMSQYRNDYQLFNITESIRRTEDKE